MPKWTEQQRDAIADRGHSLIVCAAAGSGKTAVLVERIVQLVREGCPIENMLVVTFTNAAAGEMRQRIGEALGKAAREDPALGEQVMALSRASISTLHRFCGNLLREHFQALSTDPGFRIGDEQECGVLSHQAMEDAIYSCYEVGSDAFLAADRCYTQEELSELAFALHRFMMTRPDPWAFLARAQETVRLTGEAFEQSPAARLLADFAGRRLERLCANARETLALCEGENGPLHYAAACGMDVQLTADLAAAAADGYAALHDALHGVTFAALGRKKKTDLFDEDIADRVKARRDALKKAVADVQTAFALTLEDAAADIRMTAAPLDGLAELARTYDALYTAAKRQRGMMDFNDLEHNALAALGLEESELAQIRIYTPDVKTPYHEAVRRYREEMDDALAEKLRAFEAKRARWRLCARNQGVDRLIERIYAETGFLARAGALPGGAARQANLHLLTARARTFASTQGGSLHAFLRYAERLRAGGDSMSASAIGESEDVVRMMTTHKSKGLEFPVVFVLALGRRMSGQSLRARVLMDAELGVGLPCVDTEMNSERDTLLRRAIRVKAQREQLAEEVRVLYVALTRARERLILVGSVAGDKPPEAWRGADISQMHTGLDMIAPALIEAGASLTIREEAVRLGDSAWRVFAHVGGAAGELPRRTEDVVLRLLAELAAAPKDEALTRLMNFKPGVRTAVRKTTVSAVLRDEKRAAQEDEPLPDAPLMRLPRFMEEQQMTGAQIGTAFHRMMRMLDLDALRATRDLAAEIDRQRAALLEKGVVSENELAAVHPRLLVRLFASPLGVRMLAAGELHREWAFTYRRETEDGAQLLQGVIDCCFIERGAWVLVDYKTDADAAGAIERHRPQLELYAQALAGITGRPVRERVLYLVRAGMGYQV